MTEQLNYIHKDYIKNLHRMGHRERGIKGFSFRIKRFYSYLEEKDLELIQVGVKEAQSYQGWLYEYGMKQGIKYKNSSIKSYITTAVNYFDYLKRKKLVITNPFREIRRAKIEHELPKNLLKEKELSIFLKELSNFEDGFNLTSKITRFKVWIVSELMYAAGLRIAEAANLKVNDIDFERGLINVSEGKMGIDRVCFLNEYAKELLKIYINDFREITFNHWNKENPDLLFGVKWSNFDKTVNKILKQVSSKLNYPSFTSHNFRHCLGFHLLRSGCDIRYIQSFLGHKALKNTEIYTQVDKKDLKEVFDKYHPRTFKKGKKDDQKRSKRAV